MSALITLLHAITVASITTVIHLLFTDTPLIQIHSLSNISVDSSTTNNNVSLSSQNKLSTTSHILLSSKFSTFFECLVRILFAYSFTLVCKAFAIEWSKCYSNKRRTSSANINISTPVLPPAPSLSIPPSYATGASNQQLQQPPVFSLSNQPPTNNTSKPSGNKGSTILSAISNSSKPTASLSASATTGTNSGNDATQSKRPSFSSAASAIVRANLSLFTSDTLENLLLFFSSLVLFYFSPPQSTPSSFWIPLLISMSIFPLAITLYVSEWITQLVFKRTKPDYWKLDEDAPVSIFTLLFQIVIAKRLCEGIVKLDLDDRNELGDIINIFLFEIREVLAPKPLVSFRQQQQQLLNQAAKNSSTIIPQSPMLQPKMGLQLQKLPANMHSGPGEVQSIKFAVDRLFTSICKFSLIKMQERTKHGTRSILESITDSTKNESYSEIISNFIDTYITSKMTRQISSYAPSFGFMEPRSSAGFVIFMTTTLYLHKKAFKSIKGSLFGGEASFLFQILKQLSRFYLIAYALLRYLIVNFDRN